MEKSQYELCLEVLRRLEGSGVLKNIVLVGSWCTLFYKDYFGDVDYLAVIKTRDMDLLIPNPATLRAKTDVAELLCYDGTSEWTPAATGASTAGELSRIFYNPSGLPATSPWQGRSLNG